MASSSSISSSSVSSVSFSQTKRPARMVSGMTIIAATSAAMPMNRTLTAFMENPCLLSAGGLRRGLSLLRCGLDHSQDLVAGELGQLVGTALHDGHGVEAQDE